MSSLLGVLIAGSLLGAPASAQTLSLTDAVRYALSHSPTLASQRVTVANFESSFAKQHAAQYPSLSGSLVNQLSRSSNATGQFAQFGLSQQNRFSQNTAQVGSNYALYNGSAGQIASQQSRRQMEAARDDLLRAEQQTGVNVASGYFAIATKANAVRLAQNNLSYQNALLAVARAKERVGQVAGVDVLRAQVAATQALSALVSIRADVLSAQESLAQLIGAPADTAFDLTEDLGEPALPTQPVERLVSVAQAHRPDIASAQANLRLAQLSRSLIDTDLRPQIALTGAFGNQTSPTSYGNIQAQIDAQNAVCRRTPGCATIIPNVVRGQPGFWQIGAITSFALPLIDYGTRKAAHRAADTAIESARMALEAAQRTVEIDIRQALRAAQTGATTLQYAKQSANLGAESARIAQLQYKNGLISLTDVAAAQQTSLSAQSDLFNARITYLNAVIKLRTALGTYEPISAVANLR
ncbi:MAG: TolC family protein [Candidatus Eremiobacteraeota bacterium]|nr:TolC family protein [Candidatus Eremiobacteraeota bacterium]